MNKRQKTLTLIFPAIFIATLIWFPWHQYEGAQTVFYLVFPRFDNEIPDWWTVRFEWVVLGVIYIRLLAVLKDRRS